MSDVVYRSGVYIMSWLQDEIRAAVDSGVVTSEQASAFVEHLHPDRLFNIDGNRWQPKAIAEQFKPSLTGTESMLVRESMAEMGITFPVSLRAFVDWTRFEGNQVGLKEIFLDQFLERYPDEFLYELPAQRIIECCPGRAHWKEFINEIIRTLIRSRSQVSFDIIDKAARSKAREGQEIVEFRDVNSLVVVARAETKPTTVKYSTYAAHIELCLRNLRDAKHNWANPAFEFRPRK